MLYQKLLTGDTPYHVSCSKVDFSCGFPEHRHPEAEFIYCFDGVFDIIIDKNLYRVPKGSLVLVPPMACHEIPSGGGAHSTLIIEAGPSLLRRHFDIFSKTRFTSPVVELSGSDECTQLRALFEETALLKQKSTEYSELIITGNIYKICGIILSQFTEISAEASKDMKAVSNIEKALELIHSHYAEPITVDMAASLTGYGKSNFCKIFKNIVGDTFHNVLNRKRIENACIYLDETTMPIAEIAVAVGFTEAKSFCRVFRSVTGMTPGERRKSSAKD